VLPFVGTAVMIWSFIAGFGAFVLGRPKVKPLAVVEPEIQTAPVTPPAISPAS